MKIHVFPPSGRVVGIVALKNYLALDCELKPIDLGRGDQLAPEYVSLNPNRKIPTLEDDGIVLWESNAILFCRLETSQATRKRGLSSSNGGSTAERPERADLGHAHNREEAPGGALVDDFRTLPLGQIVAGIPHIGELSLL